MYPLCIVFLDLSNDTDEYDVMKNNRHILTAKNKTQVVRNCIFLKQKGEVELMTEHI